MPDPSCLQNPAEAHSRHFLYSTNQPCSRPLHVLLCSLGCLGPALHSHFLHSSLYLCLPIDLLCSHMLECQLESKQVAKSGLVLVEMLRLKPLRCMSALGGVSAPCCQVAFKIQLRSWYHNCLLILSYLHIEIKLKCFILIKKSTSPVDGVTVDRYI